ncbi:hypothetical protein SAMN02745857_03623 [Andreprevotia lacus DSM 23236]|uniref:Uncharacterized protein n=1 Tax=Andreprevotia lacus DSM 23236 TaxID=1121001 RepID=A0A1W1Y059_9NEIS|nr:hypothetical protein [Andreprevotia lacus]SMC29128.1 hypothetical protein SAMN02745857_03623 [Andreprevotia lacus DSM 23236]
MPNLSQQAAEFLDCYTCGVQPPQGWLYDAALRQTRLDFTPDSLKRIDALLAQLRSKVAPTLQDMEATPQAFNFCLLLAFYIGEYLVRQHGMVLTWHHHDEAGAVLETTPPPAFFSRVFGLTGGRLFLPLGWLSDHLLGKPERMSATDYVAKLATRPEAPGEATRRLQRPQGMPAVTLPAGWAPALRNAGQLAAAALDLLADGTSAHLPARCEPGEGDAITIVSMAGYGDPDETVAHGEQQLASNPKQLPRMALCYPVHDRAGSAPRLLLLVRVRSYGGSQQLDSTVYFPFRLAEHPQGFAVLGLEVDRDIAPADQLDAVAAALYAGFDLWQSTRLRWANPDDAATATPAGLLNAPDAAPQPPTPRSAAAAAAAAAWPPAQAPQGGWPGATASPRQSGDAGFSMGSLLKPLVESAERESARDVRLVGVIKFFTGMVLAALAVGACVLLALLPVLSIGLVVFAVTAVGFALGGLLEVITGISLGLMAQAVNAFAETRFARIAALTFAITLLLVAAGMMIWALFGDHST